MLALKLIYNDRYDLNLGAHVFPSQKYRLVYERLLQDAIASQEDFLKPMPASDEGNRGSRLQRFFDNLTSFSFRSIRSLACWFG